MDQATLFLLLGIGLCGAAAGCASDPEYPDYPLDGITVFVGFEEPICGGTFDWMEGRLRWLEAETGVAARVDPISYYWLREDVFDYCPTGACAKGDSIYTPLELFSHELVHGHLFQLGRPRPWLTEGMAVMLEDARWGAPSAPMTPSKMLAQSDALGLDYDSAASFVRYLRDRFGMPAVIELYAALDHVDAQETPDVFLAVLGEDWRSVEEAYMAAYTPVSVGSLNCDFPVLAPEEDTWKLPVASSWCEDAAAVGPFLGLDASFIPYSERYVIVEIPEAGLYTLTMTSSAKASIGLIACDEPLDGFSWYDTEVNESIEFVPGRKRLTISTDIADKAVGEVVIRREPSAMPGALGARESGTPGQIRGERSAAERPAPGGSWYPRHGQIRADSGRGPV
ncbi:MAG TPA: hypothetical protein VGB85_07425 [Nannocystis sp.]|jgi:hypothetical protein